MSFVDTMLAGYEVLEKDVAIPVRPFGTAYVAATPTSGMKLFEARDHGLHRRFVLCISGWGGPRDDLVK